MAASVTVPPPFSASAIEEVCKVLGDAVTGDQIPNLIAPLKVPEEPDGPGTKWKRLFNAVVARQNKSQDGKGLVRLVLEVMVPVRFGSPAEFEAVRTRVNERLLLSGFEVRDDGKVAIQPGRMAAGSQGPVVKSWVSASRASMPHLAEVDR
jgi:hypothetical protein